MKGKIDSHGFLHIARGLRDEMQQYCPAGGNNQQYAETICGDWCPLFGEPKKQIASRDEPCNVTTCRIVDGIEHKTIYHTHKEVLYETGRTELPICQDRVLTFDKFTDERE